MLRRTKRMGGGKLLSGEERRRVGKKKKKSPIGRRETGARENETVYKMTLVEGTGTKGGSRATRQADEGTRATGA